MIVGSALALISAVNYTIKAVKAIKEKNKTQEAKGE